jgi:acetate kinase
MRRRPVLLVINAGSSSIKFAGFCPEPGPALTVPLLHGELTGPGQAPRLRLMVDGQRSDQRAVSADTHEEGIEAIVTLVSDVLQDDDRLQGSGAIVAVGHRIVHGGERFAEPAVVTPAIRHELEQLVTLAPLHMPHNLAAIDVVAARLPSVVQVACFDTSFHQTCPPVARRFAIPQRYHDAGIKRYGFHGLSYEYVSRRLNALAGCRPHRVVVAHLGAGASLCGLLDGKSVTTTMGYTPLDGLVMATRCGRLDPGVVLALAMRFDLSLAEVETILSTQSGLLGVSGLSGDMQTLMESGKPRAEEAIELFCRSVIRETAAAVAELGGLDCLVFTGGIGSHSPEIRQRVCRQLKWLGITLDEQANRNSTSEGRLDTGTGPACWVIRTDEQLVIAEHTSHLLAGLGETDFR